MILQSEHKGFRLKTWIPFKVLQLIGYAYY